MYNTHKFLNTSIIYYNFIILIIMNNKDLTTKITTSETL
jgi:hypothetical protein